MDRERAYRIVQAAATESARSDRHLAQTLADHGVATRGEQFDPDRYLGRHDVLRHRMEKLFDVEM